MDAWIAPLTGHTVVRIRGESPLQFLEATTTQAVAHLEPGHGALACVLDEKGHVLTEFRVLPMPDGTVLCDGEPAAREALLGWVARIAPLSGCEVIDESDRWHASAVRNVEPPGDEHTFSTEDPIRIAVTWGGPGYDELSTNTPEGTTHAGAIERARIESGRVRFGIDVTPDMIMNETPLLTRAVSFTKGCYPGQETVAKIRNLGRARRRFVVLRADGGVLEAGKEFDGGRVTSSTGDVALAFVTTSHAAEETIDAGGVRARVSAIA